MSGVPSIFSRVLGIDAAQVAMLGGNERATDYAGLLRAKRGELIDALVRCEPIASRIDVPDKRGACTELVDMAIAATENHGQADKFALSWQMLVQQLQKIARADSTHLVMHYALAAVSPVLGSRVSAQALLGLDFLVSLGDLSRHRAAMVRNLASSAKTICAELAAMQARADWGDVDLAKLENLLTRMLDEWTSMRVTGALASELDFVRLFVDRVVSQVSAPPGLWEMLLAKLERLQSASSSRGHYCVLSGATECLLAAVPRFDFLRVFGDEFSRRFPKTTGVLHLLFAKMVLDARPASDLSVRFHQAINPASLVEAGFAPDVADAARTQVVEALRTRVERVQLDWMSNAWSWFALIGRLTGETTEMESESQQAVARLASQLVEGAGDEKSRMRLNRQLSALLREAVISAAIIEDPLNARLRFRSRVAPYLDLEHDANIWKKFRQVSAGLAQIEIRADGARQLHARSAPLLKSAADIAQDILRAAPIETTIAARLATDSPGFTRGDLDAMLLALTAGQRLYGDDAKTYCAKFLTSLLFWHGRPPEVSVLKDGYRQLLASIESRDDPAVAVLRDLSKQIPSCCVAVVLLPQISSIATTISSIGPLAYAKHAESVPSDVPSIGLKQSWELGVADNSFTLGRIAYLLSRGRSDITVDLMFWWSSVLAKQITKVPRPFMACNLKLMLQELLSRMTSDEAFIVFDAVSHLYASTFGVSLRSSSKKPNQYAPLLARGSGWIAAFGTAPAPPARVTKSAIDGIVEHAPQPLREFAELMVDALSKLGDQELAWSHQFPSLFSLMHHSTPSTVEGQWLAWQDQLIAKLPVSHAALGLQILREGHCALQDVALGRCLVDGASVIAEQLARTLYGDGKQGEVEPSITSALEAFVGRLGVILLSDPPSTAVLNIHRLVWCNAELLRIRDVASAYALWFGIEGILRPILGRAELAALNRLIAQCIAAGRLFANASEYVASNLMAEAAVFSESAEEEQQWRDTVIALIVSAATPDIAPVPGTMLLKRLALCSSVIGDKSAQEWGAIRNALDANMSAQLSEELRERMNARYGQITTTLMDLARFRDAGAIEAAYQWGAAFAGVARCQVLWRLQSFVAHADAQSVATTHSEAFADAITRIGVPSAELCAKLGNDLSALRQTPMPPQLRRRRLLGFSRIEIGEATARALDRVFWLLRIEMAFASQNAVAHAFEQLGGAHASAALAIQRESLIDLCESKAQVDLTEVQRAMLGTQVADVLNQLLAATLLFDRRQYSEQLLSKVMGTVSTERLTATRVWSQTVAALGGYLYKLPDNDMRGFLKASVFADQWPVVESSVKQLLTSAKFTNGSARADAKAA
jgi:hypothetical protein